MTLALLPGLIAAVAGAAAGYGIRMLSATLRRGVVLRAGVPEVAAAAVTGVGVAVSWPGPLTVLVVWAGLLGVALSAVDLTHHRLPDAITLPAVAVSAVLVVCTALVFPGSGSIAVAAVSAVLGTAVFWLIARLMPRAFGLGDVKLVPSIALLSGYPSAASWVLALLIAFLLGAVASVIGMLAGRLSLRSAIPFGPCLLAGCWLVLCAPSVVAAVVG